MYYTTGVFNVTLHVYRILPASLLTMSYVDEKFAQHIVIRMYVHLIKCIKSNFVLDLGSRWTKNLGQKQKVSGISTK